MKQNNIKISVIIPFYNREALLIEAIKSVLVQSLQDFEIIAVDDGSTDRTIDLNERFKGVDLKVIRQENAGAASARNAGVVLAQGKYIAFLDADDLWSENKLKLQLSVLEGKKDVHMVFGYVNDFLDSGINALATFQSKTYVGHSPLTLFITKENFLKVGLLNTEFRVGEFIDWYHRAKNLGLVEFVVPDVLASRRIHNGNMDRLYRSDVKQYAAVIKAALDRKRKGLG
jgi:glycosyltransferase involved in cell wall biosynthesis